MTDSTHDPDGPTLPDEAAHRLLARAAALDAARGSELPVERLRQAALAAGIAPASFDAALRLEAAAREAEVHDETRPPWWVRGCLFGVPDRRTATGFYWLFVAALCASRILVRPWEAGGPMEAVATALGAAALPLFSLWSTSRAIRWLDRHGWDALR